MRQEIVHKPGHRPSQRTRIHKEQGAHVNPKPITVAQPPRSSEHMDNQQSHHNHQNRQGGRVQKRQQEKRQFLKEMILETATPSLPGVSGLHTPEHC